MAVPDGDVVGDGREAARALWGAGDYGAVGSRIAPIADALVEEMDLAGGWRVLDVATGSGNAALAAARCDCDVVGLDLVPALLERARERAALERLDVELVAGDATALPFEDGSFDAVTSVVGVMFAPEQERAAAEILRVCRSGGTIGLAAWTPEGMIGEMFRVLGARVGAPAAEPPPTAWGTVERVEELLGSGVSELRVVRRAHVFRYRSPEAFVAFYRRTFGPIMAAYEAAGPEHVDEIDRDLVGLLRRWSTRDDERIAAPGEYLEIIATRS